MGPVGDFLDPNIHFGSKQKGGIHIQLSPYGQITANEFMMFFTKHAIYVYPLPVVRMFLHMCFALTIATTWFFRCSFFRSFASPKRSSGQDPPDGHIRVGHAACVSQAAWWWERCFEETQLVGSSWLHDVTYMLSLVGLFSNFYWGCKKSLLLMAEILHQLRLVVYPIIYQVSAPSQVVGDGISEPSTIVSMNRH